MSLRITNAEGFIIGKVLNPTVTNVYVRCNVDMNKQKPITDGNGDVTEVSICTTAKATIEGGVFDDSIQVDRISSIYWLKYPANETDETKILGIIQDKLFEKLEVNNPTWEIEIVNVPTV